MPINEKSRSSGVGGMPKPCCNQMSQLGSNIKLARLRRKIRQEDMARRVAISVKTYRKIENGDPSIAIGLYLSALYMMGLNDEFSLIAAPGSDRIGIAMEKRDLPMRVRIKENEALDF